MPSAPGKQVAGATPGKPDAHEVMPLLFAIPPTSARPWFILNCTPWSGQTAPTSPPSSCTSGCRSRHNTRPHAFIAFTDDSPHLAVPGAGHLPGVDRPTAAGQRLAFDPGEPLVEGYTNSLWTVLLGAGKKLEAHRTARKRLLKMMHAVVGHSCAFYGKKAETAEGSQMRKGGIGNSRLGKY